MENPKSDHGSRVITQFALLLAISVFQATPISATCPMNWQPYLNKTCFFSSVWPTFSNATDSGDFYDAHEACLGLDSGAYLASVSGSVDWKILMGITCKIDPTTDFWFGLHKTSPTVNATTNWLDGNNSTFRKWVAGEPNEETDCIRFSCNGFKDGPCDDVLPFACVMKQ
jgi:hypothetical protein